MQIYKKGFTLIELLVVIAIIGLLSSVALASLNTARKKAADATIKQNLSNIRAQAEIVYNNNGSEIGYGDLFSAPNSVALSMYNTAVTAAQCTGTCTGYVAGEAGFTEEGSPVVSSWRAWVALRTDPAYAWCVDYTGASKMVTSPSSGGTSVVPTPPFTCSQAL